MKNKSGFGFALLVKFGISGFPLAVVADSVSIPNSFSAGATTSASEMNSNFSAVAAAINDNDSRITALETSSAPVFQGFSTTTLDGSYGVRSMKAACDASFSESKICSTGEFLNSIYNSSASNLSGSAWLLPEMQGYGTGNAFAIEKWSGISVEGANQAERYFSCEAWGSNSGSYRGMSVNSAGSLGRTTCSSSISVACCK